MEAVRAVQLVALIALTAGICSCAALEQARQEQRERDLEVARQICAKLGFTDGTPESAQCVGSEVERIADRRRALGHSEQMSLPTYVQPSVPSGRPCLPTAVGGGEPSIYRCF